MGIEEAERVMRATLEAALAEGGRTKRRVLIGRLESKGEHMRDAPGQVDKVRVQTGKQLRERESAIGAALKRSTVSARRPDLPSTEVQLSCAGVWLVWLAQVALRGRLPPVGPKFLRVAC